jgi:hypothetical protein
VTRYRSLAADVWERQNNHTLQGLGSRAASRTARIARLPEPATRFQTRPQPSQQRHHPKPRKSHSPPKVAAAAAPHHSSREPWRPVPRRPRHVPAAATPKPRKTEPVNAAIIG